MALITERDYNKIIEKYKKLKKFWEDIMDKSFRKNFKFFYFNSVCFFFIIKGSFI